MRRFTLITIIGLFAVLTAATVYQVLLVKDKPRTLPGPGLTPGEDDLILTDLVGMSRADAVASLVEDDLRYRVEPAGDGTNDTDDVVGQDPAPGELVAEGTEVTLRVDCTPAPCTPPPGEEIVDPCGCTTA